MRYFMIRGYSDHAANERTFLAWVRTGIAVIAFGKALRDRKKRYWIPEPASPPCGANEETRAPDAISQPPRRR